jgi:Holliday junction resolvase RusA-like endonuclease
MVWGAWGIRWRSDLCRDWVSREQVPFVRTWSFTWQGRAVGVNKRLMKTKGGRFMLTPEYRAFKDSLMLKILASKPPSEALQGTLKVIMYQRSSHDCDALLKPVIDAMQMVDVIRDDKDVVNISVSRQKKTKRADEDEIAVTVSDER